MTFISFQNIGFTGTQVGMTAKQKEMFALLICDFNGEWFNHGDCVGADADAHLIVREFSDRNIRIHPPKISNKRAFMQHATEIMAPDEYLTRNRMIVDMSDVLVATPAQEEEQLRSGTWSTIRYAKKTGKPVVIIYPDGRVDIIA